MNFNQSAHSTSHNVHCVKNTTAHYIWGQSPQEETLLDRVCAGAAFVACIVGVILLGGVL